MRSLAAGARLPAKAPEADISTLLDRLRRMIEANGPISVADYMALCLGDPEHGYYMKQDPFGRGGDFITAPEVSQLFGELVGAWLADAWHQIGRLSPVNLVELGPGRGTLMKDILRVAAVDREFLAALDVHLVEISPALRTRQRETLKDVQPTIHWHDSIAGIPEGPLLVVANEFFDALPVRQYVAHGGRWQERRIGLDTDGRLAFVPGPGTLRTDLKPVENAIVEISPASTAVMAGLAARLGEHGGAALIIDYGHTGPAIGETLQAVRGHRYADPLADPGDADLTGHVDFAALKAVCGGTGTHCHGPITQGDFLLGLGLLERAGRLGSGKDEATQQSIRDAVERLAGPDQMGRLFKVLAVTGVDIRPLPFPAD
ncbi:MAG TPA: class I SAM-dependent methyltransferase [Afifellaceae bacterium]|nr:class I SAM-dependent methyltransferase [Afifellaceae bacterium]